MLKPSVTTSGATIRHRVEPVGTLIRESRKRKGLSQQALADESGLSLRTVQRIERDETAPQPHTLKALARVLDLDLTDLVSPVNDTRTDGVRRLILSCFALIIPIVSNLIVPGLIFYRRRSLPGMRFWGSRILTFQLLWTVFSALLLSLTPLLAVLIFATTNPGRFYPVLFVYLVCVFTNLSVTAAIACAHNRDDRTRFGRFPGFF